MKRLTSLSQHLRLLQLWHTVRFQYTSMTILLNLTCKIQWIIQA